MTQFLSHAALGAALLIMAAPHVQAKAPAKPKAPAKVTAKMPSKMPKVQNKVQNVVVTALDSGYYPATVAVKAGVPVRMVFVSRGTGCANSVVIPALNKRFRLREGQKQAVNFTPSKGQVIAFACSMDMFHGKAVAK